MTTTDLPASTGVEDGLDVDKLQSIAGAIGPAVNELDKPLGQLPQGNLGWAFRWIGKWA